MPTAETGCAPHIQLLSEEVDYFNINRKLNCMLVQEMNCFKASDYTSDAVESASCRHSVNMRSDDDFPGCCFFAHPFACSNKIATGIDAALKACRFES